jgi:hypothetical protein
MTAHWDIRVNKALEGDFWLKRAPKADPAMSPEERARETSQGHILPDLYRYGNGGLAPSNGLTEIEMRE